MRINAGEIPAKLSEFVAKVARCPVSGAPLQLMSPDQVKRAGERQASFHNGVITADGRLAYQVSDGILRLLASDAIRMDDDAAGDGESLRAEKEAVQTFYDEVGWTTDHEDVHDDTKRFKDERTEALDYYWRSAQRVAACVGDGGKYFLDVSSGPVRFPEHPARAQAFDHRVCVDLSLLALAGAKKAVGDRGIYVQGDITNLPFKDDSIDSAMSQATIYHVPKDEQPAAFKELHRVLKPGGTAAVTYAWGSTPWRDLTPVRRALHLPVRAARRIARSTRKAPAAGGEPGGAGLYYHAYDYRWFVSQPWPFRYEVRVGAVLTTEFMKKYIPDGPAGRRILDTVARAEDRFPRLAGRFGRHPLIVIRK